MGTGTAIDIFISHSYTDRAIAVAIKKALAEDNLKAFIAHEDIDATEEWELVIMDALRNCKAVIAVLTQDFKLSEWTNQELGMAIALNKFIVTMRVDIDPPGFMGRYQGLPWKADSPETSIKALRVLLMRKEIISRKKALIEEFGSSHNYNQAADRAAVLRMAEPFSPEQVNLILVVSLKNHQIKGSWGASDYLRELRRKQGNDMDPNLWAALEGELN